MSETHFANCSSNYIHERRDKECWTLAVPTRQAVDNGTGAGNGKNVITRSHDNRVDVLVHHDRDWVIIWIHKRAVRTSVPVEVKIIVSICMNNCVRICRSVFFQ